MDFFKECRNLQEARAKWLTLARDHHPVMLGDDEDVMKLVNEQYQLKLSELSTISNTVHVFNTPDGRIVNMHPLKGRHIMQAASIMVRSSNEDAIIYLIASTCTLNGCPVTPAEIASLPLHEISIISNEFFKHNFKH